MDHCGECGHESADPSNTSPAKNRRQKIPSYRKIEVLRIVCEGEVAFVTNKTFASIQNGIDFQGEISSGVMYRISPDKNSSAGIGKPRTMN